MSSITRLNPNKISDTGYYFDVDNGMMFQLSESEIKFAREYFGMPNLASKYVLPPTRREPARHYRVAKEQPFNDGIHRKGRHRKNTIHPIKKFIIGGVICVVTIYGVARIVQWDGQATFDVGDAYYQQLEEVQVDDNLVAPSIEENETVLVKEYVATGLKQSYSNAERVVSMLEDENAERRAWVEKYCNIYQVDFDKVYSHLVTITDNFTNENYLNGCIPGVTCKGEVVFASSEEELILYYVRSVKQLPGKVGISTDGLYIDNGYSSSLDYASIIGYYNNLLGVDPILSYAITQSETGWNSDLFLNSNNPAGLRIDGHWWNFSTKEEGFIELALEILKYNRMGAYSIEEIGSIHAPVEDGNENWIPNVTDVYNTVSNNSEILGKLQENNMGKTMH